jgi:hypothetical protein
MSVPSEVAKLIVDWAKNKGEPTFQTNDAFNEIDSIEDVKSASDALRFLFLKGIVARTKIAGGKYLYSLRERAPEGYETFAEAQEEKIIEQQAENSKHEHSAPTLEKAKPERNAIKPKKSQETVKLPENFCLRLETPSGMTITITGAN